MEHFIMSRPEINEDSDFNHTYYEQWENLRNTLTEIGHKVTVITSTSYAQDFHITSKHALMIGQKVMLGYQKEISRQCAPYFAAAIQEESSLAKYEIIKPQLHPDHKTPLLFNGSVDSIYINDSVLMNYGTHTALEMANHISTTTGKKVIDLSLKNTKSQLIDALLMINEGQILCNLEALETQSLSYLTEIYNILEVKDHASKMPTHSIITELGAIVPENCYETQEQIAELGYEVYPIEFDRFQAHGHGPKAMVLQDIQI